MLREIDIRNLRIIKEAKVEISSRRVILKGSNGAGKTSFLEGVYLLARGKSFRGKRFGNVTTDGEVSTVVQARVRDADGVERRRESWLVGNVAKRTVNGVALSETLCPRFEVRLIGESAHSLVEGEPRVRRRFLDWNLFHVEPKARTVIERFNRALEQRNACLSSGSGGLAAWTEAYLEASLQLTELRKRYLSELENELRELSTQVDFLKQLRMTFRPGWPECSSLAAELKKERNQERRLGYTRSGPARAELSFANSISVGGFSRGITKKLVVLVQIAASKIARRRAGIVPVWLIDDLKADLDEEAFFSLSALLGTLQNQCFFTTIDDDRLFSRCCADADVFHVERGTFHRQ